MDKRKTKAIALITVLFISFLSSMIMLYTFTLPSTPEVGLSGTLWANSFSNTYYDTPQFQKIGSTPYLGAVDETNRVQIYPSVTNTKMGNWGFENTGLSDSNSIVSNVVFWYYIYEGAETQLRLYNSTNDGYLGSVLLTGSSAVWKSFSLPYITKPSELDALSVYLKIISSGSIMVGSIDAFKVTYDYQTIYTITVIDVSNGNISPNTISVNEGDNQTFYIVPNTGYGITSVVVDSVNVGIISSYTFTDVQDDHNITATYQLIGLKIQSKSQQYGTGSPLSFTMNSAPTDGNVLILTQAITDQNNWGIHPITGITQTNVTWNSVVFKYYDDGTFIHSADIWYGVVSGISSTSISIAFGNSSMVYAGVTVSEYYGIKTTSPVDQTSTSSGMTTVINSDNYVYTTTSTTTHDYEIFVGVFSARPTAFADNTLTPLNSFTSLGKYDSWTILPLTEASYKRVTTTQIANFTEKCEDTNSRSYASAIATFQLNVPDEAIYTFESQLEDETMHNEVGSLSDESVVYSFPYIRQYEVGETTDITVLDNYNGGERGYEFIQWNMDGSFYSNSPDISIEITSENIDEDHTFTAIYGVLTPHYYTVNSLGGGTVSPSGTNVYYVGEWINITATPTGDNTFYTWYRDGTPYFSNSSFYSVFINGYIGEDQPFTMEAYFSAPHLITVFSIPMPVYPIAIDGTNVTETEYLWDVWDVHLMKAWSPMSFTTGGETRYMYFNHWHTNSMGDIYTQEFNYTVPNANETVVAFYDVWYYVNLYNATNGGEVLTASAYYPSPVFIEAVPDEGFYFTHWTATDATVANITDPTTTATFTKNCTITASFDPIPFYITANADSNTVIFPNGTTTVAWGDDRMWTFEPINDDWVISAIYIDGVKIANTTSPYWFEHITADHSIYVESTLTPLFYSNWFTNIGLAIGIVSICIGLVIIIFSNKKLIGVGCVAFGIMFAYQWYVGFAGFVGFMMIYFMIIRRAKSGSGGK